MFEERRDKYVKCDKYVKIKGKEIILTNKDWRTLLERFDPCNIKHTQDGYCYIEKPCICFNYDGRCFKCPFGKLGQSGCLDAIRSIEPKFVKKYMSANYMKWRSRNCSKVKNMLTKIYVALREMKNYYEYETKPYVAMTYTELEHFDTYIDYIKNDFPRKIIYSPRMYGHLTATQTLQVNEMRRKIKELENELDVLKHQLKFYTEEKEDMMEWARKERAKRGMPF